MHQVKEFIPYETTRNLVLGHDHMTIKAFDDSDLLGGDNFRFMKVAHFYGCKIGFLVILARLARHPMLTSGRKLAEQRLQN